MPTFAIAVADPAGEGSPTTANACSCTHPTPDANPPAASLTANPTSESPSRGLKQPEHSLLGHPCQSLAAGQRVRLHGLTGRPDLNGMHASVLEPASSEEAVTLRRKQRVKVETLGERLAISYENISELDPVKGAVGSATSEAELLYSNGTVAAASSVGRGYGLFAMRPITCDETFHREEPIMANHWDDALLEDPEVAELIGQIIPYAQAARGKVGAARYPPAAVAIVGRVVELMAARLYKQMPAVGQRRLMALCDSLATPPTKTPGGVFRSNAFHVGEMDGCVFEVLSRANHSCAPNIAKRFDRDSVAVHALRDIATGEELLISYLPEDMENASSEQRRELLRLKYNFVCQCVRCADREG